MSESVPRSRAVRIHRQAKAAVVCAACLSLPGIAKGQVAGGLLPSFGATTLSGGLRSAVESVLPGAPTVNTGLAWTYSASLGVDIGLTHTSFSNSNVSGTDFTTVITPEVSVTGDTRRLTVRLDYAPQINLYAGSSGNQSYVAQNLNASAHAIIVPDTLFLDARAVALETPLFGGTQYLPNQLITSREAVQSYSFSVSPTFVHRFGGWGTLTAAYAFQRTIQDANNGLPTVFSPSLVNTIYGTGIGPYSGGYGTTGNLTTQSETASFVTGENFNRFRYEADASLSQFSGGGQAYRGSYQNTYNNTLSYALYHGVSIFGSVGYQQLHYGQGGFGSSYNLDDVTWQIGTTLTPNPDSTLTIEYGSSYGQNTVQFSGSYAVTARLRLAGSYTIGVVTGVQQQQQLLNTTIVGIGGTLVDARTGLPVVGANALGSQYGLSRVRSLSLSAFYVVNRETFAAAVTNQSQTTLLNSVSFDGFLVPANTSASSTVGSLTWQHDLNPTTSLASTVSYGVFDNGSLVGAPGSSQTTYGISSVLSHTFTESLSGHVSVGFSRVSGQQAVFNAYGANYSQSVFLVGLRKIF